MKECRRLALVALAMGFVHTVFGAIVRISGSGMGCGEHWPDCNGAVVPAFTSFTVVVELTHRVLAVALVAATMILVGLAASRWRVRSDDDTPLILRASALALALEVTAAVVGMVIVRLSLSNRYLIAVHYTLAMATLAALVVAVQRAGGLGAARLRSGEVSARTARGAAVAAALTATTVVFGALTANLPGAAVSCQGFPWCRLGEVGDGAALHVQLTHRVLAGLLVLHLIALTAGVQRRHESPAVLRAAVLALLVVGLQIVVAGWLVELRLPPVLQSVHQATGTLLWIATFTLAALTRRGMPRTLTTPVTTTAATGMATA